MDEPGILELDSKAYKGLFTSPVNPTLSKVNPDYTFKNDGYLVLSLLNTVIGIEGKIGGHAVIVVEGYGYKEEGQLFVGQYDIKVAATSEMSFLENIVANIGLMNVHGVITKVDVHENNEYVNTQHFNAEQKYSSASSISWYVKKSNIKLMIEGYDVDVKVPSISEKVGLIIDEWRFTHDVGSVLFILEPSKGEWNACLIKAETEFTSKELEMRTIDVESVFGKLFLEIIKNPLTAKHKLQALISKTNFFSPYILPDCIKSDKEKINPERGEYLPYQRFGRFTLFNNNDGHSCVTWCMDKLGLAGISFEQKTKYSIKAPPEKVVRSQASNIFG